MRPGADNRIHVSATAFRADQPLCPDHQVEIGAVPLDLSGRVYVTSCWHALHHTRSSKCALAEVPSVAGPDSDTERFRLIFPGSPLSKIAEKKDGFGS